MGAERDGVREGWGQRGLMAERVVGREGWGQRGLGEAAAAAACLDDFELILERLAILHSDDTLLAHLPETRGAREREGHAE